MKCFNVKEYGRTELALLYSPDITPGAAWRRLNKWIRHYPGLVEQLTAIGYSRRSRSFTPAQVQLIVDALGEP